MGTGCARRPINAKGGKRVGTIAVILAMLLGYAAVDKLAQLYHDDFGVFFFIMMAIVVVVVIFVMISQRICKKCDEEVERIKADGWADAKIYMGDYAPVMDQYKLWGLIDKQRKVVIPCRYCEMRYYQWLRYDLWVCRKSRDSYADGYRPLKDFDFVCTDGVQRSYDEICKDFGHKLDSNYDLVGEFDQMTPIWDKVDPPVVKEEKKEKEREPGLLEKAIVFKVAFDYMEARERERNRDVYNDDDDE